MCYLFANNTGSNLFTFNGPYKVLRIITISYYGFQIGTFDHLDCSCVNEFIGSCLHFISTYDFHHVTCSNLFNQYFFGSLVYNPSTAVKLTKRSACTYSANIADTASVLCAGSVPPITTIFPLAEYSKASWKL